MSQVPSKPFHKPRAPPAAPLHLVDPNQTSSYPSVSPQSWDTLFTVQAQEERCRFLEHQLAAERQVQAGYLEESSVMQQTFEALSMAAAQNRKDLEQEKARASRAEKKAQESERQRLKLENLLEEEREKMRRVEDKLKVLEGSIKSEGLAVRQLDSLARRRYENQWDLLTRLARSPEPMLSFKDIPWPTFNIPQRPEDITRKEVQRFVEASQAVKSGKFGRKVTKEWLLVWHPDKFCGRWLPHVIESERLLVQRGTSIVTQLLNDIMNETKG
ncbi:hypothetical protein FS749_010121 [Ceratobasidium sp. UAMH 11750]|nr:hypothetical protein FS749_010121 [Ceratobasidium sp. UAMH 11750]